jgi:Repeat of unknown function (DUF346)
VRRIITCIAALAALATAAPAQGDVFDDNPAAASRGSSDLHLFARATDGSTLWRSLVGNSWTDWSSLGGCASSGPAAAAYGSAVNVFITGCDGGVYQNWYADGSWHSWAALGGLASSAPAAAWRRGPLNYFDIAVKGGDNAIWFRTWVPRTGWSGWYSLGGNLTSAPALVSQSDGVVNVFARGTDCAVYQRYWDGTKWSDWLSLGGCIFGAPTAISRGPGQLDLFARGGGNSIYTRHWDAINGWTGWIRLDDAALGSSAAPGSDFEGRMSVFARTTNGSLARKGWSAAGGWGAWTDLGAVAVPPPVPAPTLVAPQIGEVNFDAGLQCTPPGGLLRVAVTIRKKAGKARARVSRIVFFTKGKGRNVKVDRKRPYVAKLRVSRPAGSTARVYARIYYRRTPHGKVHQKTVSRRYSVCR